MSEPEPAATSRLAPGDARRGGLLWLADPAADLADARSFAEGGYEVLVAPASVEADALGRLAAELAAPLFLEGWGERAWAAACSLEGLSGASIFADSLWGEIAAAPACPTILHLARDGSEPGRTAAIEAASPQLVVWTYDGGPGRGDGSRLARLRTLQLFARQAGRGEV